MRLAISDASILIDLSSIGLLVSMTKLPFEFVVPDFVVNEITRKDQRVTVESLLESGALTVLTTNAMEMEEIISLNQAQTALSIPDCSVLVLARIHGALILSNDTRIRQHAKSAKLECHGTVWALRQLVRRKKVDAETVRARLLLLMSMNPRLPRAECADLLRELDSLAQ